MINLIILSVFMVFVATILSLKKYSKYAKSFHNMSFMNFEKKSNLLIANENAKNEFIVISDWNFCIGHGEYLQFDIWALIDLHKLYWVIKFHNKSKSMGLFYKLYNN